MKRIILTIVAASLAAVSLSARPTGLSVGGGASIDFLNAKYQIPGGTETQKDTYFGAFAEAGYDLSFSKHSSLYAGARFSEMFSANAQDILFDKAQYVEVSNMCYFDIPVKYRFSFDISPKVQMYLNAGPTCSFWLAYNTAYTTSTSKEQASISTHKWLSDKDTKDNFNRVNLGLGGAVGVYFHHVRIEVGYDQYVTNQYSKSSGVKGGRGQLRVAAAYVF